MRMHHDRSLIARLEQRIGDLATAFLGPPNRSLSSSRQLRFGSKGSVAVEIDGEATGKWYDHEAGHGGGPLELIRCHTRLDLDAARDWGADWLGSTPRPAKDRPPRQDPCRGKAPTGHVASILTACVPVQETPAETYLRRRGITWSLPNSLLFQPKAQGGFGALVALATDDHGEALALQQIAVTDDGRKAPVGVVKRTHKAVAEWHRQAVVRLPGEPPIVLAEGVETALSVWQATGRETWACLGTIRAELPLSDGAPVTIASDGDAEDSPAFRAMMAAAQTLSTQGHAVTIAHPPAGSDANDILQADGEDAVRAFIAAAVPFVFDEASLDPLEIGSDVEIARQVIEVLNRAHGEVVCADGAIWRYNGLHWEPIAEADLRRLVHEQDGRAIKSGNHTIPVKLGKTRIDSILHELAAMVAHPDFFGEAAQGINCTSGFIRIDGDGVAVQEAHHPDHRCRHVLPGIWSTGAEISPPAGSLLATLLDGVFRDDPDAAQKMDLMAEICGVAALGSATRLVQPKAIVLKGETAENGKSQLLDLARSLLPATAVSSVTAAQMRDERHIVGLAGKLLNACDELSAAVSIASETFKAVVTGEPIAGRDVFRSRSEFRPVAQHLFATNVLPSFSGGIDRGVQRRLLVLTCNRVIPRAERIEGIGRRVGAEEADLLLAWAVEGAVRVIRQGGFTEPDSSRLALIDWVLGADPVQAWIIERTEPVLPDSTTKRIRTRSAYEDFRSWAESEGYRTATLPAINGFVQRVQAHAPEGVGYGRTSEGPVFTGLVLRSGNRPMTH